MSNSNSFVKHVVVVDIELVDVQRHRIEDIYQFEVDVETSTYRLLGVQRPSCSRCKRFVSWSFTLSFSCSFLLL